MTYFHAIQESLLQWQFCVLWERFSNFSVTQPGQPDPIEIQRQQQAKRRALAKNRAQEQFRPRTPEPVEGRKHVDVQTGMWPCHWHHASFAHFSKSVHFYLAFPLFTYLLCYAVLLRSHGSRSPFIKQIHRLCYYIGYEMGLEKNLMTKLILS